eukprot:jgi/Botrbrau1/12874/Bobra.0188s0016.1
MGYMKTLACIYVAVSIQSLVSSVVAADVPPLAPEAAPAPELAGAPAPVSQTPQSKAAASTSPLPLDKISLPPGFQISLFTTSPVEANPRSLAVNSPTAGKDLIVYVGTDAPAPDGVVYALKVASDGTKAEEACVLAKGLDIPNGVAWHNGSLYIASLTQLLRIPDVDSFVLQNCGKGGSATAKPEVVFDGFPKQSVRNKRSLGVGPDGRLYVAIGSPDNVAPCGGFFPESGAAVQRTAGSEGAPAPASAEGGKPVCAIVSMAPDGSDVQNIATGVRNSVGMDWQPGTGTLLFSALGRDSWNDKSAGTSSNPNPLLGGDFPDDVLFYVPTAGLDYGYPYCHRMGTGSPYLRDVGPGFGLADPIPSLASRLASKAGPRSASDPVVLNQFCQVSAPAPLQTLGPHVAALGVAFYSGTQFPSTFNGSIFVAEHGSWDRAQSIGYRIANVKVGPQGAAERHTVFAEGWLQGLGTSNATVWGRPVDVLPLPDGSLLVSDDLARVVYRIAYSGPASAVRPRAGGAPSLEGAGDYSIAKPAGVDNPKLEGPDAIVSRADVPELYAMGNPPPPDPLGARSRSMESPKDGVCIDTCKCP